MRYKLAEFLDVSMSFGYIFIWFILLIVGLTLLHLGSINGGQFVDLLKNVTMALFAAHSVLHYTSMVKANLDSKTSSLMAQRPQTEVKNANPT
jgi:hypothetical protein